jgi:hypothetical protein
MQWYENTDPITSDRYQKAKIYLNDDNVYPCWISKRAKYSEFHITENKKDLMVNIGESWTYGENVYDIASGIQRYNLNTQLDYTFGPIMSRLLDVDFYQYAIPGNSNGNMVKELTRILEYVQRFKYEKIYLVVQLTEPSREHAQLHEFEYDHPIHSLYKRNKKISFYQWLCQYDEIFLDLIDKIASKFKNIECIVWKNFCKWNTLKEYKNIRKIQTNWITKSAEILDVDYSPISFQSVGWFNELFQNKKMYKIKFDAEWSNKEINKIEKSNQFLNANELHSMHPNDKAHKIWANYLIKEAGWLNE